MSVERIISEIRRRQGGSVTQPIALTVKPRGSDPIRSPRARLHSGFLELEVDMFDLQEVMSNKEPLAKLKPSSVQTYFVPMDAIDWVLPQWP